jgi:glucose-6-phosphate isomerase, archaeal
MPFATDLDVGGSMTPHNLVVERRLSHMVDAYADRAAAQELAAADPIVYRAYEAAVPHETDHLVYRTTIVHPGRVGDEFYMTKGHHHHRDSAEFYYGMAGTGVLLMQTRDGEVRHEELPVGRAVYVPPGWAHRTINTGDTDFVFLAVFFGDAGHDYASIEETGFAVRVKEGAMGAVYEQAVTR